MGLPLGAVFIVNSSGCCFANGPEGVVTFWAALTAGFLALFGMLITGVFIITAFKVDDKALCSITTYGTEFRRPFADFAASQDAPLG